MIWDKATGAYSRYEYDNNGNRTFEGYITLNNPQEMGSGTKDYYQYSQISYDSMNRFTLSMGQLSGNARGSSATDTSVSIVVGSGGISTAYDLAGRRVQVSNASNGSVEKYSYLRRRLCYGE